MAIIGHTCSIGTERENIRVGRKRALAVAAYLERKGISRSRMDIRSQGESKPLFPNATDAERRMNRNVTIEVEE